MTISSSSKVPTSIPNIRISIKFESGNQTSNTLTHRSFTLRLCPIAAIGQNLIHNMHVKYQTCLTYEDLKFAPWIQKLGFLSFSLSSTISFVHKLTSTQNTSSTHTPQQCTGSPPPLGMGVGAGKVIPSPISIFKSYPHTHTHPIFKIYPHTVRYFKYFGFYLDIYGY